LLSTQEPTNRLDEDAADEPHRVRPCEQVLRLALSCANERHCLVCSQLTSGVLGKVSPKTAYHRKDKVERGEGPRGGKEVAKRWQKGGKEVVGKLKQGFGDAFQD
jgi:hypothetical protein